MQASAKESLIGGVGSNYQERVRLNCISKTWTLVPSPAGRKLVDSKWVFKLKRDANGKIARYKTRLVARGFTP
jgi:hypothetical protein